MSLGVKSINRILATKCFPCNLFCALWMNELVRAGGLKMFSMYFFCALWMNELVGIVVSQTVDM